MLKKIFTALIVILLLGGAVGGLGSLTNGFKDWTFNKVSDLFQKSQIEQPSERTSSDTYYNYF